MGKMLRIPLAMMVSVLSVFLVAGTASATSCDNPITICGCVADIPGQTYTLDAPMTCSTRFGIKIGAPNITIDGQGYYLDGGGVAGRNCEVLVAVEGDPCDSGTRMWCVGHPCRQAWDGNVTDSGIVNANTSVPGTSCNPAAPMGQGGCDGVTIKNLEITGWCNGIFVSGDCQNGADRPGYTEIEYRLTGLLIEGNSIHDNGGGDCGSYVPCLVGGECGDGGDWTHRYYNDGIFTAQIGLDKHNSPGTWLCKDTLPGNRNIIQDNIIYNQKGCGTVSCPGGNGINIQGGIEDPLQSFACCNDIRRNICEGCAMSGIQFHHATSLNRIRQNYLASNGFGGIANACPWCSNNYILSNWAVANGGCGIASNAMSKVENNRCMNNIPVTGEYLNMPCFEGASGGVGILVAEKCDAMASGEGICGVDEPSDVSCNISLGNTVPGIDIIDAVGSATATHGDNICRGCTGFAPGCYSYSTCALEKYNKCKADMNCDCKVSTPDFGALSGAWLYGLDPSKPKCCADLNP